MKNGTREPVRSMTYSGRKRVVSAAILAGIVGLSISVGCSSAQAEEKGLLLGLLGLWIFRTGSG